MTPPVDEDDPRVPRSIWGLLILALPMVGIFVVFVAYALMWSLGLAGRGPAGGTAEIEFAGCPEARPLLEARLADMGLEGVWEDREGGFSVRTQLTEDPDVNASLPGVLARPAALTVHGGSPEGEVLATNADLRDASVRLDIFMVPYVLLRLHEEGAERVRQQMRTDPGGKLHFVVDGEPIGWQSNQNPVAVGELEINPPISENQARMRAVAAWSVTLDHAPLPCAVVPRPAPEPAPR